MSAMDPRDALMRLIGASSYAMVLAFASALRGAGADCEKAAASVDEMSALMAASSEFDAPTKQLVRGWLAFCAKCLRSPAAQPPPPPSLH